MNFWMSQGHATRSTFTFSQAIHFHGHHSLRFFHGVSEFPFQAGIRAQIRPAAMAITPLKPAGTFVWPWPFHPHATTVPSLFNATV
jgi:hypothetical protein